MKKTFFFHWIVSLLFIAIAAACLFGCSSKGESAASVSASFTESMMSYESSEVSDIQSTSTSKDSQMAQDYVQKNRAIASIPQSIDTASGLQYKQSVDVNHHQTTEYTDSAGNRYRYGTEDGKLKSFYVDSVSIPESASLKSETELEEIARDFLSNYVDLSKYTLYRHNETTSWPTLRNHHLSYAKFIQGYRTSDIVQVTMCEDGTIGSFSMMKAGAFDDIIVPSIDKKQVIRDLDRIWKQQNLQYDKYEIDPNVDWCIVLNDQNKCAMQIGVIGTTKEGFQSGHTIEVPLE